MFCTLALLSERDASASTDIKRVPLQSPAPTAMEASGPLPRWQKNVYRCIDGLNIACRQGTTMLNKISQRRLPVNGIQSVDKHLLAVVSSMVLKRNMTEVVYGSTARTYTLPPTTVTICNSAFQMNRSITSVRLNGYRKTSEKSRF